MFSADEKRPDARVKNKILNLWVKLFGIDAHCWSMNPCALGLGETACHHFTFQTCQGKAGVVCSAVRNQAGSAAVWWLGRVEGGPAQPQPEQSWLLSLRLLRQEPGLWHF